MSTQLVLLYNTRRNWLNWQFKRTSAKKSIKLSKITCGVSISCVCITWWSSTVVDKPSLLVDCAWITLDALVIFLVVNNPNSDNSGVWRHVIDRIDGQPVEGGVHVDRRDPVYLSFECHHGECYGGELRREWQVKPQKQDRLHDQEVQVDQRQSQVAQSTRWEQLLWINASRNRVDWFTTQLNEEDSLWRHIWCL